ncbi:hypothetical protein ASB83_15025 [Listeria monocytogenes]|nr:hypothetical protein [Listeria monocytogenes]
MREIKFRAWDKEKRIMWGVSSINFDVEEITNGGDILSFPDVELTQYTGLKDKNGVEIYEGDALTNGDMTRTVIWREEDSQIQLSVNDDNYETRIKLTQQLINIFGLTVCGNIYANPELLKESGDYERHNH